MNRNQRNELRKVIDFVEELAWLIESKKHVKLSEASIMLRQLLDGPSSAMSVGQKYTSPNPNIHFLIGILPRLFQDERLFPVNTSIARFAEEVLGIKVTRAEKRSKYDLIGLIVCKTDKLSDQKLKKLVEALAQISGNEEKLNKIREAQSGLDFSWNETIQLLTEYSNE